MFAHSRASSLTVYRLICSGTVEDNMVKVSSHLAMRGDRAAAEQPDPAALAADDNGILWSMKRKTLENLFGVKGKGGDEFGDNGIKREELLFPEDCESEKVLLSRARAYTCMYTPYQKPHTARNFVCTTMTMTQCYSSMNIDSLTPENKR